MAQITKKYDDMDDKILSQTGSSKSECKSCKKGDEEILVDHFSISVRFHASCQLTDRSLSEDPEEKLAAREFTREMGALGNEFNLNLLSVANFIKFIKMTNGHAREDLEAMPMKELKALAKSHGIKGRSREDLVNSLASK